MSLFERALAGEQEAVEEVKALALQGETEAVGCLMERALRRGDNLVAHWLCIQALDGDQRFISALIKGLAGLVVSVHRRTGKIIHIEPGPDQVEDFLQEVMVALLVGPSAALRRYDPSKSRLTTYVRRIARNKALDRVAHHQRRTALQETARHRQEEVEHRDEDPENRLLLRQVLDRLISSLSPDELKIFVLKFVDGRTAEFIARSTKLSVQVIYNRTGIIRLRAKEIFDELTSKTD